MASKPIKAEERQSILDYFAELPDPRRDNENKRHKLIDIIPISILTTICGAEHFTEVEDYGQANLDFLRIFVELPNGIPSHDTFGYVFARLDCNDFKNCFAAWVNSIRDATDGKVVAIDGKTLRRSHQRGRGKGPLHLVSAWAANNRLTIGQVKVDEKPNDITVVPELLKLLYLKGSIVTIDAMGTQKVIVRQIRAKEADYVLVLKDNQPILFAEVERIFIVEEDSLRREKKSKSQERGFTLYEPVEQGHGRLETRRVLSVAAPLWSFPVGCIRG